MPRKLIYLFIFAALLGACKFKKADFSVEAPKDWTMIDTVRPDNSKLVKMYSPFNDTGSLQQESIIIGVMHYSSVDAYIKDIFARVKGTAVYFEEKNNGEVIINGRNILWKKYLLQLKKDIEMVEQKVYFIGYKGNIFQVSCTSRPNGIKDMQPRIDSVLNSLIIL